MSATFDRTAEEAAEITESADRSSTSTASSKPQVTITPTRYTDARKLGTVYRDGSPVLLNLGKMPDSEAKRLVDFAAGMIFNGHGAIERIAGKVFVLTHANLPRPPAPREVDRALGGAGQVS